VKNKGKKQEGVPELWRGDSIGNQKVRIAVGPSKEGE